MSLNIQKNRNHKNYSNLEYIKRFIWLFFFSYLFRFSPRNMFKYRVFLLRLLGAKIGVGVHLYRNVKIAIPHNLIIGDYASLGENVEVYNLGICKIGNNTTISQNTYLCGGTHDYSKVDRPLIKSEIKIDDNSWICANSFIGPDIYIHPFTIVGSCSNVVKGTTGPNQIIAGNPARFIKSYSINEYISCNTYI